MSNRIIKTIRNITTIGGLTLFCSGASFASVPNSPGPYVGVYKVLENSARISFLDNSTDEEGFNVYVYKDNGSLATEVSPNPLVIPKNNTGSLYQYAQITGLSNSTYYEVKVSAFNCDGESEKTVPSSQNNGRFNTEGTCVAETPGEYVGVWNVTDSSARISFKDNSTNEDGFRAYVYEIGNDTPLQTIELDAKNGTGSYQYTNINNLNNDTLHQVKITAYNSCGESTSTIPSSATNGRFKTSSLSCPAQPSSYVGVYNVTSSSARISFIDHSDNETGFKVYVYENNSDTPVKTMTLPKVNAVGGYQYATITGLLSNTLYKVRDSSFTSSCESEKTAPSSQNNGRFRTVQ